MPHALSLCMIAKNEARNLQSCLDSVRSVVDEIVLVDTGSSDATYEIAACNDALVIPFDFSFVDFAAARNCALDRATGKWIFVLDADETLEHSGVGKIEEVISRDENCGFYVERHNPSVDCAVRIFPNRKDYRYRGRVHETIDAAILAGISGFFRRRSPRIRVTIRGSTFLRQSIINWRCSMKQRLWRNGL
jgi:glycosyltransferase involved in cell wall biosynthesis